MLVILDTTAIMNEPHCTGTAFRALAHGAVAWNVRVLVPEVVLIEATAGHKRRINEASAALDGWVRKHAGPLGLGHIRKEVAETLDKESNSYRSILDSTLAELKAEIIPPPEIEHAVLVQRAASRRKPCDSNGDGYRDTLNWIAVVSLASQFPEEQIIWVSNNTKDFGHADGAGLHPELLEELEEKGVAGRVRWLRTLPDLILELAANNHMEDGLEIEAIQARLKDSSYKEFTAREILSGVVGEQLDSRKCALPPVTTVATIFAIGTITEIKLTARGSMGESGTVVEFSVQAETSVQVRYPTGSLNDSVLAEVPFDGTESVGQVIKPLIYSGMLTLDKYDRPTGGELTRVHAPDDDSGFLLWVIADLTNRATDVYSFATRLTTIPPDAYKNLFHTQSAALNLFKNLPQHQLNDLFQTQSAVANLFPKLPKDILGQLGGFSMGNHPNLDSAEEAADQSDGDNSNELNDQPLTDVDEENSSDDLESE